MTTLLQSRPKLYAVTAALCAAIVAAGWFLLISPQRAEVADIRAEASTQNSANEGLRAEVASLRALQAKLPQQQALLAQLQSKVPADPALPELVRALSTAADEANVELVGVTPKPPTGLPQATGIAGIDVELKIAGDYVAIEQYHLALEGLSRAFLVNGLTIANATSSGGTGATAGATAAPGGLEAVINGRVLVQSSEPTSTPATAAPSSATS